MDDGSKNVRTDSSTDNTNDPLVLYTRFLHHHTLSQWAETRRIAEEKRKEQQKPDEQQPQKVAASMPNQPQGEAEGKTKESNSTQPAQPSDDQK